MKLIITIAYLGILFQTSFAQNYTNIIESNNHFAFNVYHQLNKTGENLVFSPASISSAIAMTYVGAKNNTFDEIGRVFYFNKHIEDFSKDYHHLFSTYQDKKSDIQFYNANSLWIQENLKLNSEFLDINKKHFLSSLHYTSFIKEPEKSRLAINRWVEDNTKNKITNLIQPSAIDNTTRLVLVNALYFKGPWKDKFTKDKNIESDFQVGKKQFVKSVYMNKYITSWYYSDKNAQIIDIQYADEKTSLMIILPKSYRKFRKVERTLNYEYYSNYIQHKEKKRINLFLPKFNIESEFDLNKTLSDLGIRDAFSGAADFSGITSAEKLYISKVVHKANIAVDEEGTEAAAATAVMMRKTAVLLDEVEFNVNKPFIYLLRNTETNCIYFMGKVINPN
ncbi:MAG TPA: serpin family protein [Bacteroidales bacterium]|jgi:serpin B|nr:serpin family protein [Bacteroidales bacterium]